jgi:hypothetical protein
MLKTGLWTLIGPMMSVAGFRPTMGMAGWGGCNKINLSRRSGPGWTNAHAKRVARKKRNPAKHRAAGRGGK